MRARAIIERGEVTKRTEESQFYVSVSR
jgi:hypothetical protein